MAAEVKLLESGPEAEGEECDLVMVGDLIMDCDEYRYSL